MRIEKYLTVGRNHFAKPCFSNQRTGCMELWENARFQAKSHGMGKSEGATYGQDITPAILNGFGDKGIFTAQRSGYASGRTGFAFLSSKFRRIFMMTVRNEIKAQIVRAGYTMQEVVDRLHEEYDWSDSVSNLSAKLQRESIRYKEVVELADVLGYDIYWGPRKGDAFVGRGGAAERVSFRTCAEAKDAQLATTRQKRR